MKHLLPALAVLASASPAWARSLDGEGTVSLLPSLHMPAYPHHLDAAGTSLGGTAAFGYKPVAEFRIGMDIGAGISGGKSGGNSYQVLAVPLMLAGDWILVPEADVRPFLQVAGGRELLAVSAGSYYKEHTPGILQVAAGIQADLTESMGLLFDAGYLWARATDATVGHLDGGGPFVRAGITFRFEPKKKW